MAPNLAVNLKWYKNISYGIISHIENFFNSTGQLIAKNPWRTILICWGFVLISTLGLLRFHHEKNPIKLWIPPNSNFAHDTEWLISTFKQAYRPQIMLVKGKDVLTPEVLQQINFINQQVWDINTDDDKVAWSDVCFKIPIIDIGFATLLNKQPSKKNSSRNDFDPSVHMDQSIYCKMIEIFEQGCLQTSILEIWKYNDIKLQNITKQDILNKISTTFVSPVTGHPANYENLLSGITRNESGHIISAESLLSFWMVNVNFTAVDMNKVGNNLGTAEWAQEHALKWELEFMKVMENTQHFVKNIEIFYSSSRSFADISGATMLQDIPMLMIGICFMVIYVQLVLSKYNCIDARFGLGSLGLLSIGMAFLVSCSLCSLFGIFYGPVHTSFPFLLMGLGVDDMFVMMACWNQHSVSAEGSKTLAERIGLMLQHAGVSITVTSLTDFVVFIIGSFTVLPSLKSYCIYAAMGVFFTYLFVVTFFTACFTLDQKRIEQNRNSLFPCYKHNQYQRRKWSQKQYMKQIFQFVYSKVILTLPGKVSVILLAVVLSGVGLEGTLQLKQKFDPIWFIPKNTHLFKYIEQRSFYYPTMGYEAGIYLGKLNYNEEYSKIKALVSNLENSTDILKVTSSWVQPFSNYMKTYFDTDLDEFMLSENDWNIYISKFLFSPKGAKYRANFQFHQDLKCGMTTQKITASSIDFQFHRFEGPEQYIPAMNKVYELANQANFSTGDHFATAWGKIFGNWVTDEIIDVELKRNLQLALLCVMLCTLVLIANLHMCFWIFICVLLTMINVCGFMQKWGLTVDLVSCIALTLAMGLCVDYAAHIGYTFLTSNEPTKEERVLKTVTNIGAAVLYAGLSTLLSLSMLSQSEAYTFQAFFKIFLLVVLFGQFYGIIFLPVVLSMIGPKPFQSHKQVQQSES